MSGSGIAGGRLPVERKQWRNNHPHPQLHYYLLFCLLVISHVVMAETATGSAPSFVPSFQGKVVKGHNNHSEKNTRVVLIVLYIIIIVAAIIVFRFRAQPTQQPQRGARHN